MKISVITVDNYDQGWFLGNSLSWDGFLFLGRIAHGAIASSEITELPDVAIVAFDDTIIETKETIELIRSKYPTSEILFNYTIPNKSVVHEISKLPIHGLIFDAIHNQEELKSAIEKALNNEPNFNR